MNRASALRMLTRNSRPDLSIICPELLIGAYPRARDVGWLRSTHQVSAVLSLQDDADLASKGLNLNELGAAYARHGVRFHRMPVPDGDCTVFAARLDQIVAALSERLRDGHCVYLHCNAGMNRAPTVAVAYLHVSRGWSLAAARDYVKARRACVPYMQMLEAYYSATNAR